MEENFLGLLCLLMSTATNVQPPSGCTGILHSSMVNSSTSTIILKTIGTVTPSALLMAGGIFKTNKNDNRNITDFSYDLRVSTQTLQTTPLNQKTTFFWSIIMGEFSQFTMKNAI